MYINHDRRASNLELEIPESTEDSAAIVLKKRQELEAGRNRGRFPPLFVDFFLLKTSIIVPLDGIAMGGCLKGVVLEP